MLLIFSHWVEMQIGGKYEMTDLVFLKINFWTFYGK